jgi:hypothetical protein
MASAGVAGCSGSVSFTLAAPFASLSVFSFFFSSVCGVASAGPLSDNNS